MVDEDACMHGCMSQDGRETTIGSEYGERWLISSVRMKVMGWWFAEVTKMRYGTRYSR